MNHKQKISLQSIAQQLTEKDTKYTTYQDTLDDICSGVLNSANILSFITTGFVVPSLFQDLKPSSFVKQFMPNKYLNVTKEENAKYQYEKLATINLSILLVSFNQAMKEHESEMIVFFNNIKELNIDNNYLEIPKEEFYSKIKEIILKNDKKLQTEEYLIHTSNNNQNIKNYIDILMSNLKYLSKFSTNTISENIISKLENSTLECYYANTLEISSEFQEFKLWKDIEFQKETNKKLDEIKKNTSKYITSLEEEIKTLKKRQNNFLSIEEELKLSREINKLNNTLKEQEKTIEDLKQLTKIIDEKWIDEAYLIFQNYGAKKAINYIKKHNSKKERNRLKEENKKQADILLFEAKMALSIKDYKEAIFLYEEVLKFCRNSENLTEVALFFQMYTSNNKKVIMYYEESLNIRRELIKVDPDTNIPYIILTLNNFALFYSADSTKRAETESMYQEALEYSRKLYFLSNDTAMILNNLALLHSTDSTKRIETENEYKEALKYYKILEKINPNTHLADIARTNANLALFYSNDITKLKETEDKFLKSLDYYRKQIKVDNDLYLPYLANTLKQLANFYTDHRIKEIETETMHYDSLNIYRELAKTNPDMYLNNLANQLNDLAFFHSIDNKNLKEAEKEYKESLKIRRILSNLKPNVYLKYVATTLTNLAKLHSMNMTKQIDAINKYKEALSIKRKLAEKEYNVHSHDISNILESLSLLYLCDDTKRVDALKTHEEALEIIRKLAKEEQNIYGYYYAKILMIGVMYFGKSSEQLYEALDLIAPYPDTYKDIQKVRNNIKSLLK